MFSEIKGRQYEFKLGVRAAKMLEEKYDCSLFEVFSKLATGRSTDKVLYIFWVSLLHKQSDITESQALNLAEDVGTVGDVFDLVGEIIKEAQGILGDEESEDDEETDPNAGKQENP